MVDDEGDFGEVAEALREGIANGLDKLHGKTLRAVATNMAEGKDALGNAWKPLDPKTVEKKGSAIPLIDTGNLRSNIMVVSHVDKDELRGIIGTNTPYGKYHEFGAPEAGVPRRPFLAPAAKYAEQNAKEVFEEEINLALETVQLE